MIHLWTCCLNLRVFGLTAAASHMGITVNESDRSSVNVVKLEHEGLEATCFILLLPLFHLHYYYPIFSRQKASLNLIKVPDIKKIISNQECTSKILKCIQEETKD